MEVVIKMLPKYRVPVVEKKQSNKRKTHEEYVEELKVKNSTIIPMEKYQGSSINIKHKCLIDGYEWLAKPSNILFGYGCPKCAGNINKTHEEYVEELKIKNPNTEVIGKYINSKTKIEHRCIIHDEKWFMSPVNALKGSECKYCHSEKCSTIFTKSHEDYVKELSKINPYLTVVEKYNGGKTPILHRCVNGHEIKITPSHALGGRDCKICNREKNKKLRQLTHDEYLNRLINIKSTVRPLEKYGGMSTKILHTDIICQHEWLIDPAHVLRGEGCPICKTSLGERIINMILIDNTISYIKNQTYDDLIGVGGKLLSYDFYLPNYNLLIEFQGRQHEKPIDFFGGEEQFKIQQEHDRRKREYAKEHNINFLEIWYYDIDNINTILTEYLNNLKLESVETVMVS